MSSSTSVVAFDHDQFYKHVHDFVCDLSKEFGRSQHSIKLFRHLLSRVDEGQNPEAKPQIIEKFEKYVRANRTGIVAKDANRLSSHVIVYHQNVNIKLGELFRMADDQAKATIWAHLQCLLNVLNPDDAEVEKALLAYKDEQQQSQTSTASTGEIDENSKEAQFIRDIISDIEPTVQMNGSMGSNPLGGLNLAALMSKVTTLLDQGSDSLDPEKLMTTVHAMSMRELKKVKRTTA